MCHELDFEAVRVFQIGGVVAGTARVRVPVRKHQHPALSDCGVNKGINGRRRTGSKGEMVQTRPAPLM